MEKEQDEQIKKRLAELPVDVRQAIESVDLGQKIRAVGMRHGLHVDQLAALEDEIMLVMLGFADPAEFAQRLEEGLHVSSEQATQVTQEVVEEFFLPIRESMQHFMATQSASHTLEAPAQVKTLPAMPAAEKVLTEKTSVIQNPSTNNVRTYTKDPYREPIE